MCLNETYSRVQVGKHLSDLFPSENGLIQGDALSPLLFGFAAVCAIRRVQVKVCDDDDDDVNVLSGNVNVIKENRESLVAASKEIRIRDEVTIERLIVVLWRVWNSSHIYKQL